MRKLTDSERALVENNLGLVGLIIRRHGDFGADSIEDAVQIGMIGLMKAATGYDKQRGKFSTYAATCIKNELRMHWRSRKRRNGGRAPISLDEPRRDDFKEWITLKDTLASAEPNVEDAVAEADLIGEAQKMLEDIDTLPARITADYVWSDRTQADLARSYGISQSYVSRCIRRTLEYLREALEGQL